MDLADRRVLLDGIVLGEGPRWRGGWLYFSDIHGHRVSRVDESGKSELLAETTGKPSGLGFLPDGSLLIVSMDEHRLLRLGGGKLTVAADLSAIAQGILNDMVVDSRGRAYIGDMGFDLFAGEESKPGSILLVEPGSGARVVAGELRSPNGPALSPDGKTLIFAESGGGRLTEFDVEPDGSLAHRRVYAEVAGLSPDGIALDAEGAVWLASPMTAEFVRVRQGGAITDRLPLPGRLPLACALGGADAHTLFLCITDGDWRTGHTTSVIETVRVDVGAA